jgi:hypothetical protein
MRRTLYAGALLFSVLSAADEPKVPLELQTELVAKVVKYDRNFVARSGNSVVGMIVFHPGNSSSERVGKQLASLLAGTEKIGGLPHTEIMVPFTSIDKLMAELKEKHATMIYFAPGFEDEAPKIAVALTGVDCLSISTTPRGAEAGFVLGFDLVAGHPLILVQLEQSRKQNADFRSEILRISKVLP